MRHRYSMVCATLLGKRPDEIEMLLKTSAEEVGTELYGDGVRFTGLLDSCGGTQCPGHRHTQNPSEAHERNSWEKLEHCLAGLMKDCSGVSSTTPQTSTLLKWHTAQF